jgi:hypothetical protein
MADNPETHPQKGVMAPVRDTAHAPFIFFENAPAFGHVNGVVNVTLSASRTWIDKNNAVTDQVVVAYLRGNVPALLSLRSAIDSALLLAAPTGQGPAN